MTEARLKEKRWNKELKRRAIHAIKQRCGRPTQAFRREQSALSKSRPVQETISLAPKEPAFIPAASVPKKGLFRGWLGRFG